MPSKRRPTSLLGPTITRRLDCGDHQSSLPFPPLPLSDPSRFRTQSLQSGIGDQVFVFSNSSKSSVIPPAQPHANMTKIRHEEVPSYISSRSANSLISFSRPTRIQAATLHYLNKVLDELLLHVLTSAKSLATDRIKTDGILKVLGGQSGSGSGAGALLAKNAVLEAELELRNYLDDQRKEGGKVPLGLSATSRWDGTESFPIQKAYEALRIRCQYYSTLGDLEDPSPHLPQDQNIMSTDGRPMATITPGVAIYVTALLEFVGEYILQNVGRVIERDNSDEAGLSELLKAMQEDEGTIYWFSKLNTRNEMMAKEKEEESKGGKGKVGKPWRVPEASEWNEAAGRKKFQRQSVGSNHTYPAAGKGPIPGATTPILGGDNRRTPSSISTTGFESRDSSLTASQRAPSPLPLTPGTNQIDFTSTSSNTSVDTHNLMRRASSDKGWFGKRRGSVRASSDMTSASVAGLPLPKGTLTAPDAVDAEELTASDDFDSLMMSGQTMKVSLTPNRLRSIEVAAKEKEVSDEMEVEPADGKRNTRRRPGTLSPLPFRDGERSSLPSPSPSVQSRFSAQQDSENRDSPAQPPRSASRQGSYSGVRSGGKKGAAPPSAYRGALAYAEPISPGRENDEEQEGISPLTRRRKDMSNLTGSGVDVEASESKLRPREATTQDSNLRDMLDIFNSTPPMANGASFPSTNGETRESRMSHGAGSIVSTDNGSIGRKSALTTAGGKMRSLFGRKTPSSSGSISGMTRGTSEDSLSKPQSPGKQVGTGSTEPLQHRSRESSLSKRAATTGTGLAGVVALDALTKGLVDGHERAMRNSVPKPVRKIPIVDEEEPTKEESTDTGVDPFSESGLAEPNSSLPIDEGQGTLPTLNPAATTTSSAALEGLYQDTKRNSSASELSSNARTVPSRKVPWSYSRQSSGTDRRLSGSTGQVGIARVGSGASSSMGHGSGIGNAPPSAWSHGQNNGDANVHGLEPRAPTPSKQSPCLSGSPGSTNRPSDTARVLAQLNQKMKEASSADECRFLLTQALAAAAAAVHNDLDQFNSTDLLRSSSALSSATPYTRRDSGSAFGEATDEDQSILLDRRKIPVAMAPPLPEKDLRRVPLQQRDSSQTVVKQDQLMLPIKHRNILLPMAVGYNVNEDYENPFYKRQGQYASWLLGGEEVDDFPSAFVTPAATYKQELVVPSREQSLDEIERYSSADETTFDSPKLDRERLDSLGT